MAKRGWVLALLLAGCGAHREGLVKQPFGTLGDGQAPELYTLTNKQGARLSITNYGATVTRMEGPDRKGKLADVVLGYENLDGYLKASPYFGCTVGRYGNRIAQGRFSLDGKEYQLAQNNGTNNLHGGLKGFDKVLWSAEPRQAPDGQGLMLRYVSKDGEEGFPGTLSVEAFHVWTDDNALRIEYTASTDKPTVVNLTHHTYFNLKDGGATDVLGHEVMIPADGFTPINADLIPLGKVQDVSGTPFDFRAPTAIGARIGKDDEQLKRGKGYDHNWVLKRQTKDSLELAARVREPQSGRVLDVLTTDPATQFYSGNFLDGSITGKGGAVYRQRHGFCFEPQHYPDSPNQPAFPSTVLRPGETYKHTIVYRLSAEK